MTSQKPLRLWPGVVAAVLLAARFVVPVFLPDAGLVAMAAGMLGAVVVIVWWLFFSRARWTERLLVVAVAIAAVFATRPFLHASIAGGMMGMMFPISALQSLSLAVAVWAVVSRGFSAGRRRASMVAALVIACAVWTIARTDGILGGRPQLAWRWTPTAEERLLAQATQALPLPASVPIPGAGDQVVAPAPAKVEPGTVRTPASGTTSDPALGRAAPATSEPELGRAEWSGFRGSNRDSVVRGLRIETDWTTSAPVEVWRRPIGPGWSSFAVGGDRLYTQEQRGEDEIVSCYSASTGAPIWAHTDATRFYESNGGAGPRGTPTLSRGRVYAMGATGILNALDARTGAKIWSRNAASDTGAKTPGWGFSSSPLVVEDVVIVATAGQLAAYDVTTGRPRWQGPKHGGSYSSPHLVTTGGIAHVVLLSAAGATSVAPGDGKVLWEHAWEGGAIVQPAITADGDILINSIAMTGGVGIRRLTVTGTPGAWRVEERWTSSGLKPYFNDFVVHKGHAYGFDGSILASVTLEDGKRKWKGGRYGEGQLVLLADQDLLLVVSEEGEIVLVRATPDQFTEVARFQALEGKTWNHPVVVGDLLFVRNGEEMAAFRFSRAGR